MISLRHLHKFLLAVPPIAALITVGCVSMRGSSQRVGKMYPSSPAGCAVRFENLDYMQAGAKFDQVGLVTATGMTDQPKAWEGETRELLWPKVCEIGGTVVTMNSAMDLGPAGMIQFAVWRDRAEEPADAVAQPQQ